MKGELINLTFPKKKKKVSNFDLSCVLQSAAFLERQTRVFDCFHVNTLTIANDGQKGKLRVHHEFKFVAWGW